LDLRRRRHFVTYRLAAEINPDKALHRLRIVKLFFYRRSDRSNPLLQEIDAQRPLDANRQTTIARFVSTAPVMHEATTAGSDSNGHTTCGGATMVISSQIEIVARGSRHSFVFVDSFCGVSARPCEGAA